VGISGTLIALSEDTGNEAPRLHMLWPAIDKMHAEAAGLMGRLWGLEPEVCDVIGQHHGFDSHKPVISPLVPVLCVAERIVSDFGWGILPKTLEKAGESVDQNPFGCFEEAVAYLNLGPRLKMIKAQAEQQMSNVGVSG